MIFPIISVYYDGKYKSDYWTVSNVEGKDLNWRIINCVPKAVANEVALTGFPVNGPLKNQTTCLRYIGKLKLKSFF